MTGRQNPGSDWEPVDPTMCGLDASGLVEARGVALEGEGSGMVVRGGRLAFSGGDPNQRYDIKSSTKSIGVTALGLALDDGLLTLSDRGVDRHPCFGRPPETNASTGWLDAVTLEHLARQRAGFDKTGGYASLLFEPGTAWRYSDGGPNWLAECVTLAYGRDLNDLLFERVFAPIGIDAESLTWRNNSYRDHTIEGISRREFGAGISASVDALARIGLLYLRGGAWEGTQLVSGDFVTEAGSGCPEVAALEVHDDDGQYRGATKHYGLLWWNNSGGGVAGVPRDAFWSWGLHESFIVVIPSLDIVVARAGTDLRRSRQSGHFDVLSSLLSPIVQGL